MRLTLHMVLLVCACSSSCSTQERGPDLLLITVDTLRQDHVGAYGHGLVETPRIDALARAGAVFQRHYTVAAETGPAHATVMTGLYPREHGLRTNGMLLDPGLPALAPTLAAAGYRTGAAIGAGPVNSGLGFAEGFDWFEEAFMGAAASRDAARSFERDAAGVVDAALEFLAADDERACFLWVHLFDPHDPYRRPAGEAPAGAQRSAALADLLEPSEFFSLAQLERMHAGYAAEVAYVDRELGRLLDAWDARGRADVVAFTADHGEGLGEHRYRTHALYLYEEQLAVPLVLRAPDAIPAGERVAWVSSSIDLPATLLELLDVEHELGGASLLPLLEDEAPAGEPHAFAERAAGTGVMLAGERPTARLLRELEGSPGGGRGELVARIGARSKLIWSADAPDELYDLALDPAERSPLDEASAGAAQLLEEIAQWREETRLLGADQSQRHSVETQAMLEALGYGGAAAASARGAHDDEH